MKNITTKNKYAIYLSDLKIAFIYLVFIKPDIVEDISLLDTLWNVGRFGFTIIFVGLLIIKRRNLRAILYPLLICVCVLLSTMLNQGQYSTVFAQWFPTLGLIAWIDLNRERMPQIIHIFYKVGSLLIILNTFAIIIFPEGLWRRNIYAAIWILGQKQGFITCILPTVFLGLLDIRQRKKETRYFVFVLLCVAATLLIAKPIGLLVCISIIVILFLIERKNPKKFKMSILANINIVAMIFAVVIAYAYETMARLQSFLDMLPSNIMSKSETMNVRFEMWMYAIKMVKNNPLLGVGQITQEMWYETSKLPYYHTSVHNIWIDLAFKGGIITLTIFLCWNFSIIRKLQKCWEYQSVRYMGIVFFAFNIICITETPYQPMIFLIYAFSMWIEYFIPPEQCNIKVK